MQIDIVTIFPSLFDSFLNESLLKKGIDKGIIDINALDLRDYTEDKHKKVDDEPYGGGAGMVMAPQPLASAIESLKKKNAARTILLTPKGKPLNQATAKRLSGEKNLILVCGRYEGVDERIVEEFIDEEISIGDFVLNGGEVAAMALIESVFRLLPGALGNEESIENESFGKGLLAHPQYTRPETFRGKKVPQILLSGHHENIRLWREEESLKKTALVRPDLLKKRAKETVKKIKFSLALVHHPVLGKSGKTITGSVTTIDIHDLARIGKTYSASSVFAITPVEDQKKLIERLKNHWMKGDFLKGEFERRVDALDILETANSVEEAIKRVRKRSKNIKILATSAIDSPESITADEWKLRAEEADEWIIMLGTAYGLAPELMAMADYRLAPLKGRGEFNHLPVRGASAIIADCLFGLSR